ncbi:MAG: hypothetical protein WA830_02375 [Candidatus Sulfotelmatobacter sp.]
MPYPYTFAAALVLASVYVFGHKLRARSQRRWISIAAGVSVSWVFVDLLPEIAESQARFSTGSHRGTALFPEQAIFLAAMLGFMLFYGLECMVAASAAEKETSGVFSSLRITAFAGYSSLIAYLLIHNPWRDVPALLLYCLAMAFHFLLVCHSLFSDRNGPHGSPRRWILALSVMVGWSAGILISIPEQWLARITGFICGGVIMNTLVVELPEGHGGRFWPFVLAATAYSLVLILVLG